MTRTDTLLDRSDASLTKALAALDTGFTTKSAQKDANSRLSSAYEDLADIIRDLACCEANKVDPDREDQAKWFSIVNQYDLPFGLHQLRDKHIAKVRELQPRVADRMAALVNVREAVKAEPIQPAQPAQPKTQKTEFEVKAEKTLAEEMERLNTQFLRAVDLARIFNGVPVTANSHMVTNQYGTTFIRTFYYLEGKLTRLNLIIAAAEKVAREKAAK